jgi:hypothetical protein
MAMTITGGLSKSERQHVQRRVWVAMAPQVVTDGRYQGGRAPYGYVVVDAGPHPNPREGSRGLPDPSTCRRQRGGGGRGANLQAVSRRSRAQVDRRDAQRRRCPLPVGAYSSAEPASPGRWLAAHDGEGDTPVSRSTDGGRRSRSCWTRRTWLPDMWCASGVRRSRRSCGRGSQPARQLCLSIRSRASSWSYTYVGGVDLRIRRGGSGRG